MSTDLKIESKELQLTDANVEIPSTPEERLAKATEFKEMGNKAFGESKYVLAIEHYTMAIAMNNEDAVFWANRSFSHHKLEEYGAAVQDASMAIKVNAQYTKGYYRRGAALMAMGKSKEALKDFQHVARVRPNDKDAKQKLNDCLKIVREEEFLRAISSEGPDISKLDYKSIEIESSYDGPRLPENGVITPEFVLELTDAFRKQKRLHKKYVYQILSQAVALCKKLPTMVDITLSDEPDSPGANLTVCGDVHGQFYDLCNIFELNGRPSTKNGYLFNGDFVDRGSFSFEVIMTLLSYKLCFPDHFHLLRGNHETINMNAIYGFKGEVLAKADATSFDLFTELFNWLPLAACVQSKILILHGGLFSRDGVTLDDIRKIQRHQQPPEGSLMSELLWADPQPQQGRSASKRGVGMTFGPDVTHRFLKDNGLDLLIRSHEVKMEGYEVEADNKLITIFSAPNYCDSMGNKGAFIRFDKTLVPKFTKFTAVPHPPVQPMAFAQPFMRF